MPIIIYEEVRNNNMVISPDVQFIGRRTPENLTGKDLRQIMFYMDWNGRHKCVIKFKSYKCLEECKDYLVEYVEEKLGFKVKATAIRPDVLKLEKDVETQDGEEKSSE